MQRRRCRELHEPGQMSTDKDPADTSPAPDGGDRRRRVALRALVDELLGRIRDASMHPEWSAEERARAEADLERIMASVRAEAMRDRLPER
jgi:hypothetical protein